MNSHVTDVGIYDEDFERNYPSLHGFYQGKFTQAKIDNFLVFSAWVHLIPRHRGSIFSPNSSSKIYS